MLANVQEKPKLLAERNSNIDIIRIFSALMVLSVHIGLQAGFPFEIGAKGVQLFFILSGYLGMASLARNDDILHYYKNRLLRILPTYYVCLLLLWLEDLFLQINSHTPLKEIFDGQCGLGYLRYVFFLQMMLPSDNWSLWNNHSGLWTMSSFALFYVIAPFLYRIFRSFYRAFAALIVLLFANPFLIRFLSNMLSSYPEDAHIEWFSAMNPFTELYCFMIGIALFWAIKESKINVYSLLLSIILVVTKLTWYPYEFMFAIMITLALVLPNIITNKKMNDCIVFVSKGSFTLYLVHPMILAVGPTVYGKVFSHEPHGKMYAFYLYAFSFLISYLVHYFIVQKIEVLIQRTANRNSTDNQKKGAK